MNTVTDIDRDTPAPTRPSFQVALLGFVGTTAAAVLLLLLINGHV